MRTASFAYDANGALLTDGSTQYAWNAREELSAVSGDTSATFAYDGIGRRRTKTIGGASTRFLYDGLDAVQEQTGGGAPSANILAGLELDEWFTRSDAGGTRALLADVLRSTLALADEAGTVQTAYTYAAFGATQSSGAASGNAARFTGREDEGGTGLYFYRARFYDTEAQRFLNEDPLGFLAADPNFYAYAFSAPTTYTDPTGEHGFLAGIAARCLIGGGISAGRDWFAGRKIDWGGAAVSCGLGALGGPRLGSGVPRLGPGRPGPYTPNRPCRATRAPADHGRSRSIHTLSWAGSQVERVSHIQLRGNSVRTVGMSGISTRQPRSSADPSESPSALDKPWNGRSGSGRSLSRLEMVGSETRES